MIDDGLTPGEAELFGTQLEALCSEFSLKEQEFLRRALRLAAADTWAHAHGTLPSSSIRDLVLDIHEAGSGHAISRNPLPVPLHHTPSD